jgi:hypothetical protein
MIGYDTQESLDKYPPENLDHLRCNGMGIKTYVGIDIDEV